MAHGCLGLGVWREGMTTNMVFFFGGEPNILKLDCGASWTTL